jgi:apolipoprotein N-acyltransferase
LNEFFQRHETAARCALAVVAGLLLAAAFPTLGIAGLAWIAPGLLLFSAAGQRPRVAFQLGWLGGFAFHLAALHWLLSIPVTGFPILGWLALSAYAAVYPGLWVWLCWRLASGEVGRGVLTAPPNDTGIQAADGVVRTPRPTELLLPSYGQRAAWALKCAVLWVALETIVGCVLTGFPWLAVGMSQHRMVTLVQAASVAGVAAVSFLPVWFAVALVDDLVGFWREGSGARKLRFRCLVPMLVAGGIAASGVASVSKRMSGSGLGSKSPEHELTLALVQPSIPQSMIWNPAEKANRFAKLMQLSELALATKPDVLVWPEAALPELNDESFRAITNLVATHKVWMVFGADDYELKPGAPRDSNQPGDYAFYNSAFLLTPEGRVVSTYRKRHLVLFGEYIPLVDWLPFLKWFTPIQSGFTPGKEPVAFGLGALRRDDSRADNLHPPLLRAGMLICFEDAMATAVRDSAADADFLLNLTNDGWFGEGAQQYQHAAHSVFRAVENRRPVVRCTNNGLTCWVDEHGFMHDLGVGDAADVYGTGFRVVKLRVPASGSRPPTFYQRHGNWFGWGCVFVALVLGLSAWRLRPTLPSQLSGTRSDSPKANEG